MLLAHKAWVLLAQQAWVLLAWETWSSCLAILGTVEARVVPPSVSWPALILGAWDPLLGTGTVAEAVLFPET